MGKRDRCHRRPFVDLAAVSRVAFTVEAWVRPGHMPFGPGRVWTTGSCGLAVQPSGHLLFLAKKGSYRVGSPQSQVGPGNPLGFAFPFPLSPPTPPHIPPRVKRSRVSSGDMASS